MLRSYLFAPGHRSDLVAKACAGDADAVILDLEDAVPPNDKPAARRIVTAAASRNSDKPIWVRVNAAGTADCERDLTALAGLAVRIRVPKVERPDDLDWIAERAPGLPLSAALETAVGVFRSVEIAGSPVCAGLSIGGLDLRRDLSLGAGELPMLAARSTVVMAARLSGLPPPVDSVYPRLRDDVGLRQEAEHARSLGYFGKAAIHPRQLPIIHDVFSPSVEEVQRARETARLFAESGGAPFQMPDGEFVDVPVARRAEAVLALHDRLDAGRPGSSTK